MVGYRRSTAATVAADSYSAEGPTYLPMCSMPQRLHKLLPTQSNSKEHPRPVSLNYTLLQRQLLSLPQALEYPPQPTRRPIQLAVAERCEDVMTTQTGLQHCSTGYPTVAIAPASVTLQT